MPKVIFQRPVEATLYVHLANGEQFAAKPEDLAQFGLVKALDAYVRFQDTLATALIAAGLIERDKHLTECELNALRHLVETAVCQPSLLTHPENVQTWAEELPAIERDLRSARAANNQKDK